MKCKLTLAYQNVFGDTVTVIREYTESEFVGPLFEFVANTLDAAKGIGFDQSDVVVEFHNQILVDLDAIPDPMADIDNDFEANEIEAVKERMNELSAQGLAEKVIEIIQTNKEQDYVDVINRVYDLCQPYCKSS